jgi:hypothetical protein
MSVCTAQIYVSPPGPASDDDCRARSTTRAAVWPGDLRLTPRRYAYAGGLVHGRLGSFASAAATSSIACWLSGCAMASSS